MLKKKNSSSAIKNNFNNKFFDFSKIGVVSRNICKQGKQLRGWNFFQKKKRQGSFIRDHRMEFFAKTAAYSLFFQKKLMKDDRKGSKYH